MVSYSYAVTNTGNVTLDPVSVSGGNATAAPLFVSDSMRAVSAISCPRTSLAPGQSMTCTATYITTKADLHAGEITNTGTATATPPETSAVPDPKPISDSSSVIILARVLTLKENVSRRVIKAGNRVTYHLTVSNPTPNPIDHVRVCDQVPLGLAYASSRPHADPSDGSRCWNFERIPAHGSRTIELTAIALDGESGTLLNHASARAPDVPAANATRAVRVAASATAPTPVTG